MKTITDLEEAKQIVEKIESIDAKLMELRNEREKERRDIEKKYLKKIEPLNKKRDGLDYEYVFTCSRCGKVKTIKLRWNSEWRRFISSDAPETGICSECRKQERDAEISERYIGAEVIDFSYCDEDETSKITLKLKSGIIVVIEPQEIDDWDVRCAMVIRRAEQSDLSDE